MGTKIEPPLNCIEQQNTTSKMSQSAFIGNIDERGYLKNMFRRGFTMQHCLCELFANAIDTGVAATNVSFYIYKEDDPSQSVVVMVDNGRGMDYTALENMFSLNRENHAHHSALGVSGVGAKPALAILSDKQSVRIVTKRADSPYYTAVVPWDKMYSAGRYTKMIHISESDDVEIGMLTQYVGEEGTGTMILFSYSPELETAIMDEFLPFSDKSGDFKIKYSLAFVFGRFSKKVQAECSVYEHKDHIAIYPLRFYHYFGGSNRDFYTHQKFRATIQAYHKPSSQEKRYIWYDTEATPYEICAHGRGFSKDMRKSKFNADEAHREGWIRYGEYSLLCGARKNKDYFNEAMPRLPSSAGIPLHPYDAEMLAIGESDDKHFELLSSVSIVRNNQFIGSVELPDIKISSARANTNTMFEVYVVRAELHYSPISSIDNIQDIEVGIQENKNQFISTIPLKLLRTVRWLKKKFSDEIWSTFSELSDIDEPKQESPPILNLRQELPAPQRITTIDPYQTPIAPREHVERSSMATSSVSTMSARLSNNTVIYKYSPPSTSTSTCIQKEKERELSDIKNVLDVALTQFQTRTNAKSLDEQIVLYNKYLEFVRSL